MTEISKKLKKKLAERKEKSLLRTLPTAKNLIDFSSNDYLGFANNETIYAHTFQFLLDKNISQNGARGSRLISGNHILYSELESHLSNFHQTENALVFNSGYDANIGFFGAIPQRNDLLFYDEFIHASIRDGIKLSNAKSYKFKHNDIEDLKNKIEQSVQALQQSSEHTASKTAVPEIYIVTESIFSMDGDMPDLKKLCEFCAKKRYYLIVDEAHAIGIFGNKGAGLAQKLGLQNKIFARIVTFGKALGCHGAAILGSNSLKKYLVNYARSLIYTTALPPHTIASVISAYTFLENENGQAAQKKLKENIVFFKSKLEALNSTSLFIPSESAIQSCVIAGNKKVNALSKKLSNDGFEVKPILSPTVPEGKERLRFCLHNYNTKEEIGLLLQLLKKYV